MSSVHGRDVTEAARMCTSFDYYHVSWTNVSRSELYNYEGHNSTHDIVKITSDKKSTGLCIYNNIGEITTFFIFAQPRVMHILLTMIIHIQKQKTCTIQTKFNNSIIPFV